MDFIKPPPEFVWVNYYDDDKHLGFVNDSEYQADYVYERIKKQNKNYKRTSKLKYKLLEVIPVEDK